MSPMPIMKAASFVEPGRFVLQGEPMPDVPQDALGARDHDDHLRNYIEAAYELFGNQRDGVLKVAITP